MPLQSGERLGPYEILSPIGAGGMGEVYKARDTRLDRTVAVKVAKDQFSERFEREARAVAALNHPNICQLYDVGPNYLVMEFVEGATVRGPMLLDQARHCGRQICDALEAAHARGIVHRDLKPANIKITPEGTVKVLDFGLATVGQTSGSPDPASSPTLTISGVIMGTAGYMSPEQARGATVDKRADIWAFGVVLYEMLTGCEVFSGETVSDKLASVLKTDPDWSKLPRDTPPSVRRLLRRCLERDRKKRLQDIGDARLELEEQDAAPQAVPVQQQGRPYIAWGVAAAFAISAFVATGFWWRTSQPVSRPLVRLDVELGVNAALGGSDFAISPDGSRLVYTINEDGKIKLATRAFDQPKPLPLPGTEHGGQPFFSPDGQWVAFEADGKLKKVMFQGGGAVTLCDAGVFRGGSWGDDGNIIAALTATSGLSRISSSGGAPQLITRLNQGMRSHRWPQVLPGSNAVLYMAAPGGGNYDDAIIEVQSLKTGKTKVLVSGATFPRYLPSGHLLYTQQGVVFAASMDLKRLELEGKPVPMLQDVSVVLGNGLTAFEFSADGTFVYSSGVSLKKSLAWVDRSGKTQPLGSRQGDYSNIRLSPDGRRIAMNVIEDRKTDIWIYDCERDTMTRLTSSPGINDRPQWTPDGQGIVFNSAQGKGLFWIRADGAGEIHRLTQGKDVQIAGSFSPDGKRLAFSARDAETAFDIWTVAIDWSDPKRPKPSEPAPFLRTRFSELDPSISPDGRWLAYRSNESGTEEVYVRPFTEDAPAASGKWQISSSGGFDPRWSPAGHELLYKTLDGHFMAAAYTATGNSFAASKPQPWGSIVASQASRQSIFDFAPDGKRLVMLSNAGEQKPSTQLVFLMNFFDELRRRVPAGK